jgi:hypothetical protein
MPGNFKETPVKEKDLTIGEDYAVDSGGTRYRATILGFTDKSWKTTATGMGATKTRRMALVRVINRPLINPPGTWDGAIRLQQIICPWAEEAARIAEKEAALAVVNKDVNDRRVRFRNTAKDLLLLSPNAPLEHRHLFAGDVRVDEGYNRITIRLETFEAIVQALRQANAGKNPQPD